MVNKIISKNLLRATIITILTPFSPAYAVVQYNVSDLGNLGGVYSQGLEVNSNGIAVGFSHLPSNISEHAIVSDGLAAPIDLGTFGGSYSQGYGINNLGQVVGSAYLLGDSLYHGFKWQGPSAPPLTPLTTLSSLVNPGHSRAFAINDSGVSTGFSLTAAGTEHAVRWTAAGVISDLGTLNVSNAGNSYGLDINLHGQVVGYSSLSTSKFPHAVTWTSGTPTTIQDLGTLGGNFSSANAINHVGEITGSSTIINDSAQHAFIWKANQTPTLMRDIGTLGGTHSEGFDINAVGDVVGYSTTNVDVNQRAFLWQNGIGIQDLNSLIDPASGWVLLEAHGISDDGIYITGLGTFQGEKRAFLLKQADTTPPEVSFAVVPSTPNGTLGWYRVAPSVTWSVTDLESDIASKVGCTDVPAVANTAPVGTSFSCVATSLGGTSTPVTTPVIKVDTTAPVIAGVPAAFTQQASSPTGAVVSYTLPTATDALSGVSGAVSCLPASGAAFPMGATTVNCSVSDVAGNSSSASFVVTVADNTPPVVVLNTVPATPNSSGWFTVAPNTSWSVTDAESAISNRTGCLTVAAQTNTAPSGRTLSCKATSAGGTTGPIKQLIKVDTTLPTMSGVPVNSTIAATSSAGAVVTYIVPTASDTFSGVSAAGVSCLPASGATLPIGTNTVTCSVSDVAGNSTSASFVVTVEDQSPPQVSFAVTPTAPSASGWYRTSPKVAWTVADAQSAITSPACVDVPSVGNTLGQSFSCSATSAGGTTGPIATPLLKVDTAAPTLAGVPVASSITATSAAGAVVTYTLPTATDAISGVSAAGVSCLPSSGATLPVGVNSITCSASDIAGNTASASFSVTVNSAVTDSTPPQVSAAIVPAAANGLAGWYTTAPSVTWSVGDAQSAITSPDCVNVPAVGNTLGQSFSCSATSTGGTTNLATTLIKVDTTSPSINVPASFTRAATSAAGAVVTYATPTATDTFSGVAGVVSCLPASGATLPLGATTVTCSARDVAGNSNSASFVVTVADQTAPVFTSCPATVTLTQGQTLPLLVATDNVSTPVVTRTPAGTLGLGTTAVTWTATDQAGLNATCLQQVTVNAAVAETITPTSGKVQCKRINATSGEWSVLGTSSITTTNSIQLYSTATVPADLTTNRLGTPRTVSSQGGWQYQAKPGPACVTPISLQSAKGTVRNNIAVAVQ